MEALGLSSAATRTSIRCGVGGSIVTGSRRNLTRQSHSQLFSAGKKRDEKCVVAKVDDVGVSVQERVRETFLRERSKVLFATVAAGIARVESALALSYDEVVSNAEEVVRNSSDSFDLSLPSVDIDVDTSGITDFISSNPLAIVGGVVVLALPVIASNVFKKPQGYGTVSAAEAYAKLGDSELVTQILDIRVGDDIRSEGTPDLRSYRKKVIQLPFVGDAEKYVEKVKTKFKDAENTTVYILDRFDGSSAAVAKLLVQNGFKSAYAIKDGAEGPRGWQSSELPWLIPRKGFTLDLGNLKDVFDTDSSSLVPTTIGVAAAAGAALVVFSEAETALQLLGSAALVQIFLKKLLFAEDRKKTFSELQTFLNTKVAPQEFVSELKGIGKVLLPKYEEVKAATANGAAILENTVESVAPTVPSEPAVSEPKQVEPTPATVAESPSPDMMGAQAEPTPAPIAESPSLATSELEAPAVAEPVAEEATISAEAASTPAEVAGESGEKPSEKELVTVPSTKSTELPRANRPLSPYTQFPGMKPPGPPSKP